ncbi:hypothetical protein IP70_13425 [alpha proteobacterium AAP38]|nr:hypothetical protein IP70_13425 [alpha proteobacterium AAP38]
MMAQCNFDCIAGRDVCGWAWNPASPTEPVSIRVLIDGQLVAEGPTGSHQPYLQAAGIGQGNYAFFIPLPGSHLDGHAGELVLAGSEGAPLYGTPVRLLLPDMRFRPVPPAPVSPSLDLAVVVAIVKDEAPYLLEWIAHHR